jgi:polyhydroxybutyrate depolymerase
MENSGRRFWNATESCCNFFGSNIDDVGFLRSLILAVIEELNADPKRVFLFGHSNGGFMAYRMACEHADLIAGIAIRAGATYQTPGDCQPSDPVSILHVHGTADAIVFYDGDDVGVVGQGGPYPGALETVGLWASYNGCSVPQTDADPSLNLDVSLGDPDTIVTRSTSCPTGAAVELWSIQNAGHRPDFTSEFPSMVVDWLLAHPKP